LCRNKKKKKYAPNVHLHSVNISDLSVVPMLSARHMTFVPLPLPPVKIADLDKRVEQTVARRKNVAGACRSLLDGIFSHAKEAMTTAGAGPDSKLEEAEDANETRDRERKAMQRSWFVSVWAGLLPCVQKSEDFQEVARGGENHNQLRPVRPALEGREEKNPASLPSSQVSP
jgi:hypothetical protein